jgi:hypothetical protein
MAEYGGQSSAKPFLTGYFAKSSLATVQTATARTHEGIKGTRGFLPAATVFAALAPAKLRAFGRVDEQRGSCTNPAEYLLAK